MSAKVLVIEDDHGQREALSEILSRQGYEVQCASNGSEALELMRRSDSLPRLILLDVMMPVMDGWEFRDQQRRDRALSEVPVVVMTAFDDTVQKALQSGAVGFCLSPSSGKLCFGSSSAFAGQTRQQPGIN
jgi:CheY-like chemotaxis protein